jgi:DNA-binding response OmpR family regulator
VESKARILVVDDDPRYVKLVRVNLEPSGYEVVTANTGQMAIDLAAERDLDLILLDIMMPGLDGYQTCKEIRRFSQVPVIMLTALGHTDSLVRGLDAGADDYIAKPFSAQELLARIRALLRRAEINSGEEPPDHRPRRVTLDTASHRVYVRGEEVHLTNTEYRLLSELVTHAGRVLVQSYLLDRIWDADEGAAHLLWQTIHRLRQKIEPDPSDPQFIQNRPGIGYIYLED